MHSKQMHSKIKKIKFKYNLIKYIYKIKIKRCILKNKIMHL